MQPTKVKDVMTCSPVVIAPENTLREAARKMSEIACGVLPVGSTYDAVGIITDRDIVIRAVAKGKDPNTEMVRDYMTPVVFSCTEEQTLEEAASEMCRRQVNRLIVKDKQGRMSGIITFGCILRKDDDAEEVSKVVERATGRKAA